jgi:hypothetical protein
LRRINYLKKSSKTCGRGGVLIGEGDVTAPSRGRLEVILSIFPVIESLSIRSFLVLLSLPSYAGRDHSSWDPFAVSKFQWSTLSANIYSYGTLKWAINASELKPVVTFFYQKKKT